jgi:hypothetical protein
LKYREIAQAPPLCALLTREALRELPGPQKGASDSLAHFVGSLPHPQIFLVVRTDTLSGPMPDHVMIDRFLWPKPNIVFRGDIEAHNPIIGETRLRCRVVLTMVCSDDGRIERKNDFHDYWLIVYPTTSIHRITFHKQYRLSNVPFA